MICCAFRSANWLSDRPALPLEGDEYWPSAAAALLIAMAKPQIGKIHLRNIELLPRQPCAACHGLQQPADAEELVTLILEPAPGTGKNSTPITVICGATLRLASDSHGS